MLSEASQKLGSYRFVANSPPIILSRHTSLSGSLQLQRTSGLQSIQRKTLPYLYVVRLNESEPRRISVTDAQVFVSLVVDVIRCRPAKTSSFHLKSVQLSTFALDHHHMTK